MTRSAPGARQGKVPPVPGGMAAVDPFRILGLDATADLTDEQVRAAWRKIAAATHPDRSDRGDLAAFAAAAAAYTTLRTRTGRGEALADLQARRVHSTMGVSVRGRSATRIAGAAFRLAARLRGGRPGLLALRLLAVAAIIAVSWAAVRWQPACPALVTGAVTWLILTGRRDLAPRRDRAVPPATSRRHRNDGP